MSEADTVQKFPDHPQTVQTLTRDLLQLGIRPGSILLVHSSLSAIGWVCGSAPAVILALEEALGGEGTLVMPAHSGDLSDPSFWENPPVPESWWETIRQTMPAFDPDLTPTRGMGAIPEAFRKQAGVLRSAHPHVSFSARGPHARQITENHGLENELGEGSPLSHLYSLDAAVLLLGVGHESNTSLHLAEVRASYPSKKYLRQGAPVMENGERIWKPFNSLDYYQDDFEIIGAEFERQNRHIASGLVGHASCLLFSQRSLVDFAVQWMQENRA